MQRNLTISLILASLVFAGHLAHADFLYATSHDGAVLHAARLDALTTGKSSNGTA
jgi:hypothetical protein